ncbi:hypothetical protein FQZ97_1140390 [compost metagenome]
MDAQVAAFEQAGPETVLEFSEHLADGRLAQVQARRSAAHRGRLGQRHKQLEVPQAQRANEAVGSGVHFCFHGV